MKIKNPNKGDRELKKTLSLLLILALCISFFTACGEKRPTLRVFNWGEYMDPEVTEIFEKETGINVIYETYETNESMYTKVVNSGSGNSYDIVFPSEYMMSKMIREGLIAKLNKENIPNADMMLDSGLESEDALKVYAGHPDHVRVADNFVRPYTVQRLCLDFNV